MIFASQPEEFPRACADLRQKRFPGKVWSDPALPSATRWRGRWLGVGLLTRDRLHAPLSDTVTLSSSPQARTHAIWHDSCSGLNFSLIPVHLTFVLPVGKDWNASTNISAPS